VSIGLNADLGGGFYPLLEVGAQACLYRFEETNRATSLAPTAAVRASLGLGKH